MPQTNPDALGQIFKWVRERDGRKQVEIARAVNITSAYLSMIESGARKPPAALVKRLARVYGCPRALLEGLIPLSNDNGDLKVTDGAA
jgi:transcriptional regulator with XRE-family HTH domain